MPCTGCTVYSFFLKESILNKYGESMKKSLRIITVIMLLVITIFL